MKATGNKPIKLKDREKQFLEILNNKDSPVYKVPCSVVVGINETTTAVDVRDDKPGTFQEHINQIDNGHFRNKKKFKKSIRI